MDEELVLKTSNTLTVYWGFDSLRFRNLVFWCNGLAPIVTADKVWVRIPRRLQHPMCVPELGREKWKITQIGKEACLLNK